MERQQNGNGEIACAARALLAAGALAAALAVIMGAFGAHALRARLGVELGAVYRTAVDYHFYHALGLLTAGLLAARLPEARILRWAGALLGAGIVLFSGSLYAIALGAPGWFGAVTPFGGLAFIGGWASLAWGVLRGGPGRARG
ncbi:MAG: DUF423 domain-containing protein [Gammaproteobacteria bacterium]|nr:DUF423 domain-containing protein [Gammaproteobacteria bacterium]